MPHIYVIIRDTRPTWTRLQPPRAGQTATFLNGSQTGRELPHAERSGSCFQQRAHQSQASGRFNFLKPQRPLEGRQGRVRGQTGRVKCPRAAGDTFSVFLHFNKCGFTCWF